MNLDCRSRRKPPIRQDNEGGAVEFLVNDYKSFRALILIAAHDQLLEDEATSETICISLKPKIE